MEEYIGQPMSIYSDKKMTSMCTFISKGDRDVSYIQRDKGVGKYVGGGNKEDCVANQSCNVANHPDIIENSVQRLAYFTWDRTLNTIIEGKCAIKSGRGKYSYFMYLGAISFYFFFFF